MHIRSFLVAAHCLLVTHLCHAEPDRELAQCAATSGSVQRLECFDKLASARGALASPSEAATGHGKWAMQTTTSPIDDSKSVVLALEANEPVKGRFGQTQTPVLFLRCKEKKTEAYINFGMFLGTDSTAVTSRLDKEKATKTAWAISTDHQAAFVPNPLKAMKSLASHSGLFVEVIPYSESPISTSFDLGGLAEALKPLAEACGWKKD